LVLGEQETGIIFLDAWNMTPSATSSNIPPATRTAMTVPGSGSSYQARADFWGGAADVAGGNGATVWRDTSGNGNISAAGTISTGKGFYWGNSGDSDTQYLITKDRIDLRVDGQTGATGATIAVTSSPDRTAIKLEAAEGPQMTQTARLILDGTRIERYNPIGSTGPTGPADHQTILTSAQGSNLQLGPIMVPFGGPLGPNEPQPFPLIEGERAGFLCVAQGQVSIAADYNKWGEADVPLPQRGQKGGVQFRMGGPEGGALTPSGQTGPAGGCVVFDFGNRGPPGPGEIWVLNAMGGNISVGGQGFGSHEWDKCRITFASGPTGGSYVDYQFVPPAPGTTKTFIIPHPLDNLRDSTELLHSCVEAPTVDNIYRGSCRLMNGKGLVNLDSNDRYQMTQGTFQALNKDPQVHVTNNETFDRVRGEIIGNELHIICENPDSNANVAWLVIGTRHDPSIRECPKTDDMGNLITERPRN